MRVVADLTFSYDEALPDGTIGRSMTGTVRSEDDLLVVDADQIPAVSTRSATPLLRQAASVLAAQGLTLAVNGPDGRLVTMGVVRSRFIDRLVTRSKHVRLGRLGGLLRVLRRRRASGGLGLAELTPPPTMFPIAPTFRRNARRVTTTHDAEGGGRPRLLFPAASGARRSDGTRVFYLKPGVTTIGSDPECDLVLVGVDPVQAEIERNEHDEYVLRARGANTETRADGREVEIQLLRTGSRIEMGGWLMSYFREEYADHGRPYGGRIGGELGYQRSQTRPEYRRPRK